MRSSETTLPLFSRLRASARACFYDLSAPDGHAPKALKYFAQRFDLPVVTRPDDLATFDVVFFSLHSFRDFYRVAKIAHAKRPGQQWIAGGNACATPRSVAWVMDYVWVGDCRRSFAALLAGDRDLPSLYHARTDARVVYADEDIVEDPLSPSGLEMSKGCRRRCLFCVHPWRHRYQEASWPAVEAFARGCRGRGVELVSNSSNDVSYYADISRLLTALGKTDMVVSNSILGLTPDVVCERKREMLLGVEGMSERLRWVVNKPISRDVLLAKVGMCLGLGKQVRTVYQFNLPGETQRDIDEFESDVAYLRRRCRAGSWSIPFIPNQPSAHTPFQWVVPHYDNTTAARLMDLRRSLFGSGKDGMSVYMPAPLGAPRWFAQVVAEWVPVTPAVAAAVDAIQGGLDVPSMVDALAASGVVLPETFLHRTSTTVFPWDCVVTTGSDPDKRGMFDRMVRRMTTVDCDQTRRAA